MNGLERGLRGQFCAKKSVGGLIRGVRKVKRGAKDVTRDLRKVKRGVKRSNEGSKGQRGQGALDVLRQQSRPPAAWNAAPVPSEAVKGTNVGRCRLEFGRYAHLFGTFRMTATAKVSG